ncbi:hypothetical protein OIO90_005006 [Microbotryomycetes sp. JL221]|nr:hypothetical protein OIO90_005006 [Microbotryomycetes sp. JL221]
MTADTPFVYESATVDDIRRAAAEVERRIDQRESSRKQQSRPQMDRTESQKQGDAARVLQHRYQSYQQQREANGRNLTCSQRWEDGLRQRALSNAAEDRTKGINDSTSRWKRSALYATKIREGTTDKSGIDLNETQELDKYARDDKEREALKKERDTSKAMEKQYWLEICDHKKHRYGTNLKWYHQKWNESNTPDNFFKWLDEGEGKDLDLEQCPRSRLEKERITFLNAEQRQNYLVKFNDKGFLVWAKNGKAVNTTKYHRDAGPDVGIVEMTQDEYREKEAADKERRRKLRESGGKYSSSSSESSSEAEIDTDELERDGVHGYQDKGGTAMQGKGIQQVKQRMNYYLSPRAVMDRALRDTVNKNTIVRNPTTYFARIGKHRWLFVSDLKSNLYVGIKKTGAFQHSSFLSGARVLSAGLIKVDEGKLTSLSPLSGHYRAGTLHFKAFVRSLEDRGVDMTSVSISKSVLTIRGIEHYASAVKRKDRVKDKIKRVLNPGKAKSKEEAQAKEAQQDVELVQKKHREHGDEPGEMHSQGEVDGSDVKGIYDLPFAFDKPLPGQGKNIKDMTEEERLDRGVALVQRAFERGWRIKGD